MAGINPLQLPRWEAAPQVDWSPLNRIGDAIGQYRRDARMKEAIDEARATGKPLDQLGMDLIAAGERDTGMAISRMAQAQAERAADNARADRAAASLDAYRSQSLDLQRRAYEEGKLPQGFRRGADGGLEAIPGGPADPEYLRRRGEATTDSIPAEVEQRRRAVQAQGLDPNSPNLQAFILSGRMPREDQQPLTATDKKAILEADEMVAGNEAALKALGEAKGLSPQAHQGFGASTRATIANNLPDWLVPDAVASPQSAAATTNYENLVLGQALSQLKTIFGAAPTEGERKILVDLQASADKPDSVRQDILARAQAAAQKRLEFNRQRADALRGGGYYKPGGEPGRQSAATPAAPSKVTNSIEANDAIAAARDAIAKGAPRDQVLKRLRDMGVPIGGL